MSIYVDIAIAVILVFFALSLVVTALNEVISVTLNLRGRLLWRTFVSLVDDEALRDHVLASAPVRAILRSRTGRDRPPAMRFPDWLPSREVARAVLNGIVPPKEGDPSPAEPTLIGSLVAEARAAVEDEVSVLARRYDAAMVQLSLRYKRRQQVIAALLGVALAGALNIDILAMAGAMSANEALRDAIVGHAEAFVTRGPVPGAGLGAVASGDALPTALSTFATELGGLQTLSSLAGMGWTEASSEGFLASPTQMCLTIVAWVIAGLSTVLGAPFWFDLLSRAVHMRPARSAAGSSGT